MNISNLGFKDRWVAFFDILGFSENVLNANNAFKYVLNLESYNDTLRILSDKCHLNSRYLSRAWFSDSFIIYSKNDSAQAYSYIQMAAKQFLVSCLYKRIPMRGAVVFGSFLVNKKKNIFIGKALVEAVREAEKQNWIGLLITKTAIKRAHQYKLDSLRHSFGKSKIPLKNNRFQGGVAFNFSFGSSNQIPNLLLPIFEEMQNGAPKKAKVKYRNTINQLRNIIARNNLSPLNKLAKGK